MDNGEVIQVGNIVDDTYIGFKNPQRGRIYSADGISPCLNTVGGGNLEPKILTARTICMNSKVNGKQPSLEHRVYDSEGIATAVTTGFHPSIAEPKFRIRKLTPRECFRLMGVDDADIDKIQAAGISNSQQYKMAGNSIVVDNLYHIFRTMFVDKPYKAIETINIILTNNLKTNNYDNQNEI